MSQVRYWMLHGGHEPAVISEAQFREITNMIGECDQLLWVDDSVALCSKRVDGLFYRATSKRYPERLDADGELRPASARTLLAVLRSHDWLTPSEAFRLGNPGAAEPSDRNAFVTFSKGRQLLDVELGHERWRAFAIRRRSLAGSEFSVRFAPPPDLRWLVAWSEPAPPTTMVRTLTPGPSDVGALPVSDLTRVPILQMFMGLEIVILDAFLHLGRDEVVLLMSIDGTQAQGPWVLEQVSVVTGVFGDDVSVLARPSTYGGSRVEVPGEAVARFPCVGQALPDKVYVPFACVAFRFASRLSAGAVGSVTRDVLIDVRAASGQRVQRSVAVAFRVVG